MSYDTGGPAFPQSPSNQPGMTLADLLAGISMHARCLIPSAAPPVVSPCAFDDAAALLAERAKRLAAGVATGGQVFPCDKNVTPGLTLLDLYAAISLHHNRVECQSQASAVVAVAAYDDAVTMLGERAKRWPAAAGK